MNQPLVLAAGGSEVVLLPYLGGAIGGFSVEGRAILRPTPVDAASPLETACFPLLPYANRIADGRFSFAGRAFALPVNVAGFEHPLHGLGWLKAWSVENCGPDSAVLACSHEANVDWPWNWSAEQRFQVEAGVLRVTLEVTNRSAEAMPCGIGQHPYFVREPAGELTFAAAGVWLGDERMIPAETTPADHFGDFANGAAPHGESLTDNCWFGWDGVASWGVVEVRSDEARFLHVFAPPGEDFICLEPTSQMPDALNQPDFAAAGGAVLEPGGTQGLTMEIRVRF
ncbi:MAG TPA: aldose 1-epimerase [Novosphingobium sp.]|nr:aldose 1-epimerase [Novosphingobium sp.]